MESSLGSAGMSPVTRRHFLAAAAALVAPPRVEVRKLWDQAPHNAFTDLVRRRNRFFCAFREGAAHVSPDGAIRILVSRNGRDWTSAARLRSDSGDLRDPKLSITARGELMLLAAAALKPGLGHRHQSYTWFSPDGLIWNGPFAVGDPDFWLWRAAWHDGACYATAYPTASEAPLRLYRSGDGRRFELLDSDLAHGDRPNECGLGFERDGTLYILVRREAGPRDALLLSGRAPYTSFDTKSLGVRIGGPALLRLNDGTWIAGVRLYEPQPRTALLRLDPAAAALTEWVALPSGGDTSYPGMVEYGGRLWVSYYSSHEGKTAIYLATVDLC
jgi:hypothetical protein